MNILWSGVLFVPIIALCATVAPRQRDSTAMAAWLALYVACMQRGILDFFTGGKVLLQNNVDRHHILPRAQFAEKRRQEADNIASIAFVASDVNKSIGQSGPEVYLNRIAQKVLKSQCIPNDELL